MLSSPTLRFLLPPAAVYVAAGTLLALVAPYGTGALFTLGERLAFWILSSCLCGCLLVALYLVGRNLGRDYRLSPYIWLPTSALLAAIPATLIVQAAATAVNAAIQLQSFWRLYPSVLLLCLPLQFILHLMIRTGAEPERPVQQKDPLSPVLAKLPGNLGDDILCMKMEDHYLRVFTPRGNALILMRISDAERTVGGLEGLRVHRSWWVARAAVKQATLSGSTLSLVLSNGVVVPVSRERRHLLQANGWLD